MIYSIRKSDLENDLLFDTLKALSGCLSAIGVPLYVVGATARDIAMKLLKLPLSNRRTIDLDVAIAIEEWSQYEQISKELMTCGFTKEEPKQRFTYQGNGYEIDLVPFGGIEQNEQVCWPPEGNPVMSVKCFKDVMNHSIEVNIEGQFDIRIASLCGQFLIKLDTWMDRHLLTDKDARDMNYILSNYYVANISESENQPSVIDITEDFEETVWGARWIAYELRSVLSVDHQSYYCNFISEELDKGIKSEFLNDLTKYSDTKDYSVMERSMRDFIKTLRGGL